MSRHDLPTEAKHYIRDENIDFVAHTKRIQPVKSSLFLMVFGGFFLLFPMIFVYATIVPIFQGQTVNITINDVPTKVGPENLEKLMIPGIIIGIFSLIGLAILLWGVYALFSRGYTYIATPKRLVRYRKGKFKSYNWENFSGNIEVHGDRDDGEIVLEMRFERTSRKNNTSSPTKVHLTGIENVFHVESICRKRIEEHDPTPVQR